MIVGAINKQDDQGYERQGAGCEAKRMRLLSKTRWEVVGPGYSEGPRFNICTAQAGQHAEQGSEVTRGANRLVGAVKINEKNGANNRLQVRWAWGRVVVLRMKEKGTG
jgi:hypothetical protein